MPAMLDDPKSPTIYRTSGGLPYPDPNNLQPSLPVGVFPRQITLRDRVTVATILPFSSRHQVPSSLLAYLCDQFNKELEGGDTYPIVDLLSYDEFSSMWFQNFGAIVLLGHLERAEDVTQDWSTSCLGSFYIKPNYPGRSSHVCNGGFLVTGAARNRGVGKLMGEAYIDWAPKLGYIYSVFNLVYETNVASLRIWDALGFKRIGRVKGCGNLKSYPNQLIDAIIFGRDLGPEGEDLVSEERFDKIKFYLKCGKYPNGADRAEKSRLRSAATHYKLLDGDKLMLKDKEVISDPKRQYEIARKIHLAQHGGINKTTAAIAELYHWIRIKETVNLVIKNCDLCKEMGKVPVVRGDGVISKRATGNNVHGRSNVSAVGKAINLQTLPDPDSHSPNEQYDDHFISASLSTLGPTTNSPHPLDQSAQQLLQEQDHHMQHQNHRHQSSLQRQPAPAVPMIHHGLRSADDYIALDPQIMEDMRHHLGSYIDHGASHTHDQSPYHNPFQTMLAPHTATSPQEHHLQSRDHGMSDAQNNDLDMLLGDDEIDDPDQDNNHHELEAMGNGGAKGGTHAHAQLAARVADAAMRGDVQGGKDDGNDEIYGGHRYRHR